MCIISVHKKKKKDVGINLSQTCSNCINLACQSQQTHPFCSHILCDLFILSVLTAGDYGEFPIDELLSGL